MNESETMRGKDPIKYVSCGCHCIRKCILKVRIRDALIMACEPPSRSLYPHLLCSLAAHYLLYDSFSRTKEEKAAPLSCDCEFQCRRVLISAIYLLFSAAPKSYDLVFIYSPGIHDFNQQSSAQDAIIEGKHVGKLQEGLS
jgi:hypothetical protein